MQLGEKFLLPLLSGLGRWEHSCASGWPIRLQLLKSCEGTKRPESTQSVPSTLEDFQVGANFRLLRPSLKADPA